MRKNLLLVLSALCCSLAFSASIYSKTVSVSASVPGTNISFSGYTAPSNIITLSGSLKELGRFRADKNGIFYLRLTLRVFRKQDLCLTATDVIGNSSPPVCLTIGPDQFDRNFTQIALPPSLQIEQMPKKKIVRISGYTLKEAKAFAFLDSTILELSVPTDQNGFFSQETIIDDHRQHAVFVKAIRNHLITPNSIVKHFQIPPPPYTVERIIYELQKLFLASSIWLLHLIRIYSSWIWLLIISGEIIFLLIVLKRHRPFSN